MTSDPTADIDFWEFVSCAKCHLPYASEPGKSVPFWLTECGHVICNNHLNPDQSCASCGSSGILLVALQQELDSPMSDWFRSIPSAMDSIAYAVKFQQEVLARQIRFYRSRHQQIRTVMEKLRSENSELKRTNESLIQENEQMRQYLGYRTLPSEETRRHSESMNQLGKRPLETSTYQYDYPSVRPRTGSSPPQYVTTPTRLTLPAGQHVPGLTIPKEDLQRMIPAQPRIPQFLHTSTQATSRPMSRQIGKYAYIPPETPHTPRPSFPRAQLAAKHIKPSQTTEGLQGETTRTNSQLQEIQQPAISTHRTAVGQQAPRSRNMGPPPLPQVRLGTPAHPPAGARNQIPANRRFIPSQNAAKSQPQPSHGPQRFIPGATGDSLPGASWPSSTNSSSRGASGTSYG